MTRKELLLNREYWVVHVTQKIWEINKRNDSRVNEFEAMAEKIVDKDFMNLIKELTEIVNN